jgi:hypothetical protein
MYIYLEKWKPNIEFIKYCVYYIRNIEESYF